jgi:hypothetical protein
MSRANPYAVQRIQQNTGIGLQDIPADVLERMVPNESALALSRTSKKMRAAAHAASVDLVVEARPGHKFSNGQGLLAELNGFSPSWTVTVLRLRDCNLRVRGGAALAFFLEGNTTLTELDVGSNSLQEPGGLALAAALRGNTTLTKLDIRRNVLGDRVGTYFATLLRGNSTLRCLDIGFNRLGSTTVINFARELGPSAMPRNETLTSLYLSGNELRGGGASAVPALARALRANTTLTELDLQWTYMDMEDLQELTAALGANTTLARLDLRYLPPLGNLVLQNILLSNPALGARVLSGS